MSELKTFPKQVRLLKKKQFDEALAKKKSFFGEFYTLYYHSNGLNCPRLGIIAAKKSCRLAVLRNQLKRVARESFRHYQNRLPAYDLVVITRQTAQDAGQKELRQCLDNLFSKLIHPSIG